MIDSQPKLLVKNLFRLKRSLPEFSFDKFFANETNETNETPIKIKPKILKIVCLLILNFKNGNLIKDLLLAIIIILLIASLKINRYQQLYHTSSPVG